MFLCQEHPDTLRKVGFSAAAIARCSSGRPLGDPTDASGMPLLDSNGRRLTFHVHHRVPLQAGGSNGIDNLCLVGSDVHGPFFHSGDDPRLNRMAAGEVRKIALTVPRPDIHVIAVGLNIHQHHYTPPDEKGRAA